MIKEKGRNRRKRRTVRGFSSCEEYAAQLRRVIAQSREDAGYDVPWGVALTSYLPTAALSLAAHEAILQAQRQVIADDPLVFLGVSTDDLIGPDWRPGGGGHFNEAGLKEHARRWAAAVDVLWVPEPGTLFLILSGMCGMVLVSRHHGCAETELA